MTPLPTPNPPSRLPAATAPVPRAGNSVPEEQVASMFDAIAPVYDRLNTLMTAGLDGRWRRAAVRATALRAGGRAIDVACGTGKLTAELARRVGVEGHVTGIDFAPEMIELARSTNAGLLQVSFETSNALALPYVDATFDAATIAFGLRNLASFEAGLREMARVVRPGGRVVCLELALPRPAWAGRAYWRMFRVTAPAAGRLFRHRTAYAYLPASLDGFPDPETLAATMRAVGLRRVTVRRLALGAVSLLAGER